MKLLRKNWEPDFELEENNKISIIDNLAQNGVLRKI